jgi:hypothetical protein
MRPRARRCCPGGVPVIEEAHSSRRRSSTTRYPPGPRSVPWDARARCVPRIALRENGDMLQIDAAPGIHRVEDDNTNWCIVDGGADDGLTLVDAGVPCSWDSLHAALSELERPAADIRALVLTHAHSTTERARTESGIPVHVHENDVRDVFSGSDSRPTRRAPEGTAPRNRAARVPTAPGRAKPAARSDGGPCGRAHHSHPGRREGATGVLMRHHPAQVFTIGSTEPRVSAHAGGPDPGREAWAGLPIPTRRDRPLRAARPRRATRAP